MKIITIGSCLSHMTASRMTKLFGGYLYLNIVRTRSDQFCHYVLDKDLELPPRSLFESKLKFNNNVDSNYIGLETMLNEQYDLGKKDLAEFIFDEKIDTVILDNYVDIGAALSYLKLDEYNKAPLLIRKNDFSNYDDYFKFGDKLSLEESAVNFKKIFRYLKLINPNMKIVFLHYPYNTYVKNIKRQERSKQFVEILQEEKIYIISPFTINKASQIENEPAHFKEDIYISYAKYIYSLLHKNQNNKVKENNINKGLLFKDQNSYSKFPEIRFGDDIKWKLEIHFQEYSNDGNINFFFGERGSRYHGFARVKNKIFYRLADGSYIGGLSYTVGTLIKLEVTYDEGNWIFSNSTDSVTAKAKTEVIFNAIGSGFTGHEHEEKTRIEYVKIQEFSKNESTYKDVGIWKLNENRGCIAFDSSGNQRHAVLSNTKWQDLTNSTLSVGSYPLAQDDWHQYTHTKPNQKFAFLDEAYNKEKDLFLWTSIEAGLNDKNWKKGEKLLENIYDFNRFEPAQLPATLTWKENPLSNRSWRWQFHQIIFYIDLLAAHSKTEESKYLDKLVELLTSWYDCNYVEEHPSEMSWHDHTTALRLRSLIYIWEYLRQSKYDITEDFANMILNLIETHCNVLSVEKFYMKHNNHGFDQSLFLYLASVKFPEFENAKQWHDIAFDRLVDEVGIAFTSEGMHIENSPSYLVGMIQRIELASKMIQHYEPENNIELNDIINNALKVLAYLVHPNGTLPMLGDTDHGTRVAAWNQLKSNANFQLFQYVHSQAQRGSVGKNLPDAVFEESGYAVLRDKWHEKDTYGDMIHLVFKCGFLSKFHRHDDDLNFVLHGLGEEWFVDGGIYKYDEKNVYRKYLRSAKAHNIPVIANVEVSRLISKDVDKQSKITEYFLSEETSWVEAKSFMYTGYCVTRKIEYIRPNRFIITDKVDADTKETTPYELMFHIPMDKKIEIRDDNSICICGQNAHELHMLFDGECSYSFEVLSGEDEKEVIGWQSKVFGKIEAIQTLRCHVVPAHNKAHSIVELTLKKVPTMLEKSFDTKIVSANNIQTNNLDDALKTALGFTENSSLEYINKTLSSSEYFNKHFLFEDVLSIEELASKEEDAFNKQALNIVSALRNKQVLLKLYQTGDLNLDNGTSIKARFSITDGVYSYTFFSDGSELNFWLAQRHHNVNLFFMSQQKVISLVKNPMHIEESINGLKKTLLRSFQGKSFLITEDNILKKLNFFVSYSRPFHFFVDLMPAFLDVVKQISTKEIGLVYLNKDSFYPVHKLHYFNFIENFENIEDLNNLLITNRSVLLKPVKDLMENNNIKSNFYKTLIDVASKQSSQVSNLNDDSFFLWISICAEKRSWVEQEEGANIIIEAFFKRFDKLTVILDGMTAPIFSLKDEYIADYAFADHQLACNIIKSLPKIKFINAVGLKAPEKMVLAEKVDFFVTSFLTDSMYVARFSNKYGLAHGASLASPRQHRHPHTVFLPRKFISDIGNTQRNWSVVSYSISPGLMVEWCMKILDTRLSLTDDTFLLTGNGFELSHRKQRSSIFIKSILSHHTYICIGEPYSGFVENTDYSHVIYKEEYLFRFEAFSKLDSALYIIGYQDNEKVFTERFSSGMSKYINFPENATHFRLFLRLSGNDEVEFFDVHWNTFSSVGSAKLGGYIE